MSAAPPIEPLCGPVCELGEGPAYDPVTGTLYWFDILGRRLVEMDWKRRECTVHALPEMASAIAMVDASRQVLATESGLCLRERGSGHPARIADIEADNAGTRSNDARVHPSGAFWVSTMGKAAERGAGAIYWFRAGELRRLLANVTIPNSICFSPDGGTAYFTDTADSRIMTIACDPATGLPAGEPAVFRDTGNDEGGVDGSVVDAEGVLWNARWGAGRLDAYGPDGRHLRSVPLPASRTSCPAFVGPSADRLVVTSAWQGMSEEDRAAEPMAGRTFLVELAVRGRFDPPLRLSA